MDSENAHVASGHYSTMPMVVGGGATLLLAGFVLGWAFCLVGLALTLAGIWGWITELRHE